MHARPRVWRVLFRGDGPLRGHLRGRSLVLPALINLHGEPHGRGDFGVGPLTGTKYAAEGTYGEPHLGEIHTEASLAEPLSLWVWVF